MATYRKPLKDINGNFIIPAMTGDQTEWIQTGDIADGAVTKDKIDLASLNPFVITNDTATDTYFVAERTDTGTSVSFGVGAGGINHGIWSMPLNKWMIYSDGTYVYVNGIRVDDYRIKQYLFTVFGGTEVAARANLNTPQYCEVGRYYCSSASAGSLMQNNPSGSAFTMEVRASWDTRVEFSGTWCYKTRIMYALTGVWYQVVHTDANGGPSYGAWRQLHN